MQTLTLQRWMPHAKWDHYLSCSKHFDTDFPSWTWERWLVIYRPFPLLPKVMDYIEDETNWKVLNSDNRERGCQWMPVGICDSGRGLGFVVDGMDHYYSETILYVRLTACNFSSKYSSMAIIRIITLNWRKTSNVALSQSSLNMLNYLVQYLSVFV